MSLPVLRSPANLTALARARGAIAASEQAFRGLQAEALRRAAAGDDLGAAAWALIACQYGAHSTMGRLAAPKLERLLVTLGRRHVPGTVLEGRAPGPERVLHVLTETYAVGGHTRVAVRWMQRDAARVSSAVLTGQVAPLPEFVPATVATCGGELHRLGGGDLFRRARALRRLATGFDLVVLHAGAQDVVPALAFADPVGRPPTILFDHANSTMWIGAGAADLVASLRPADAANAAARRGIDASRVRLVPIPVDPAPLPPREEARARLGLARDVPVVLAVASPYKLEPVVEPSFTEIAGRVLDAAPSARLIVAGPAAAGPYAELEARTSGRARALGPVSDLSPLLAAADVHLDSWPASGGTTVLDAASAGLPIVSLDDGDAELVMSRAREPAVEPGLVTAGSPAQVAARVAELLEDAPRRSALGARLRASVAARHGEGWTAAMEDAVSAARRLAGTAAIPAEQDVATTAGDEIMHLLRTAGGEGCTPKEAFTTHAHELPAHLLPDTHEELEARLAWLFAREGAAGRRAIAAPALDPDGVRAAIDALRELHAGGRVERCAVVVPGAALDEAVALLEAALAAGGDLDLDVLVADDPGEVLGGGDVLIRTGLARA